MSHQLIPDPELDGLIRKLNAAAREAPAVEPDTAGAAAAPPAGATAVSRPGPPALHWVLPRPTAEVEEALHAWLGRARSRHASDLLLVSGARPVARIHGRLEAVGDAILGDDTVAALCAALVPARHRARAEESGSVDFASTRGALGRLRCNVHRERGRWAAAIRLLPDALPDLQSLMLPPELARFADLERGLVLVTGPTGSGKSTTLAALVRQILERRRVHLVTIEDPVEYEHAHGDSVVEHVEIGRDVDAWARALRAALRQDPDVLLIGEMRDPESISVAITAAETGHLVLSTLHTGDAPQTVHRVLDSYPAGQIDAVRAQLSVSLAGVVSQQLLPRRDGRGRVPAVEVLMATDAVRHLIRQNKIELLRSQITLERAAGMLSLDRSLADLVARGLVAVGEARLRARLPTEFDALVRERGAGS